MCVAVAAGFLTFSDLKGCFNIYKKTKIQRLKKDELLAVTQLAGMHFYRVQALRENLIHLCFLFFLSFLVMILTAE